MRNYIYENTSKSLEDWAEKLDSDLSIRNLCSERSNDIWFSEKSRERRLSENSLDNLHKLSFETI